jgi:starch-binding outer membrane protein, SusD/RagB family
MKRIASIICLSLALSFTSCTEWLDMPSETKFDSSTIFESLSKAEMAVIGCYPSTFNRELYYQLGMGTDECMSTEGDTNSKNQIANYVYTTSNAPTSTYTSMYTGIEYANVCIKGLEQIKASNEAEQIKINQLLGEVYAIRAMNFLNLVRFFGDVPYPTIPVVDMDSFESSRVDRDIVLDGCVADLQKATELLTWQSEGLVPTAERFTKNAAFGILARVSLYAAGYSLRWDLNTYDPTTVKLAQRDDQARIKELYKIAADACKMVIDKGENTLVASYENIFRDLVNDRYNSESMLEIGQWGSNVNDYVIGYTNGMYTHTNSMFGKSQPAMHALPTYYFDFEEGDTRRDVTICNYGISGTNVRQMNTYASNTIGKFRATWKEGIGTAINKRDINWPMLRYADVLLMYAEALNEYNNGPTPDAIKAFEDVRTRAFGNDASKIGTTPAAYDEFRQAIINERKLELGFEAWRRTDLVRWGVLFETLSQAKQNVIDMANRTGKYANIDLFRAYKQEAATSFADPVVAVPYIGFKEAPSATEKAELEAQGYSFLEMHSSKALSYSQKLGATETWVTSLFRGLEKNKVELLPLNTTSIIDVNPGLAGQQHPLY